MKETLPVRLYSISCWWFRTLYLEKTCCRASGSMTHLKRFGSETRSTTFELVQYLIKSSEWFSTHKTVSFKPEVVKITCLVPHPQRKLVGTYSYWTEPFFQQGQLISLRTFGAAISRCTAGILCIFFIIPFAVEGPFPKFKSHFWNFGIREVKSAREIGNFAM